MLSRKKFRPWPTEARTTRPDWPGHINDLLRFFMDTNQRRERDFDPDAFEPGEMMEPPLNWP